MTVMHTSFVLAYHGCKKSFGENLLSGNSKFIESRNNYDWLGHGIYFWESNPNRAKSWAQYLKDKNREGKWDKDEPFVVGAVIDLGLCLDLTTESSLEQVKNSFDVFQTSWIKKYPGHPLPDNKGGQDLLLRKLDCHVINTLHELRKTQNDRMIDTVRGVFIEGNPLYDNSGFRERTHTQICVRNAQCIKGIFRV